MKYTGLRQIPQIDMTAGSPVRLVVRFSIPLILANLFQQTYSMVDAAVVGKVLGVDAFAAIGCTGWIIWLVIALCRDCSNAFCIVASMRKGAKDQEGFRTVVTGALITGIGLSVALTAVLLVGLDQILHYLNVPANIYDQARQFLFVFILSVPPIAAVYLVGALLRAAGNSTVTSYAMTVSTILNIGLVLLFVLVFHWSVVGTAVATLIAQCVSAAIILFAFFRSDACRAAPIDWRAQAALAKEIAKLWLPMLLNSVIIAIGGNMVQREINALGSEFTAGIAAGTKIFSLLEAVIMALQTGLSVYVGQNLGARRAERVRDGARKLVGASILITLFMVLAVWAFGGTILSWFLSAENEKAYLLAHGAALRFTRVITAGMFIMTPMYLYRMMVQLLGHSEYPVIAGVLQLFARVAMVQLLPRFIGEYAYYMTDVAAWIVSLPVVMIPCMVLIRRLCQKKESLR